MAEIVQQPVQEDDMPERERKRDIAARYLKQGLSEGELALKRAAGLGAVPNVVPQDVPVTNAPPREILVGWHPVGGVAGKWFANDTALGRLITDKINRYPDPTQHWAVLVGEYAHQLWMDENFDVIYTNQKVVIEEWTTFSVGNTRFNDDAVRRTGEMVIQNTRETQAAYNLISNNCQTYALRLLDAIKADGECKFPTTNDVYGRLFGPGKVMDLFKPVEGEAGAGAGGEEAVSAAENIMAHETTQLDAHMPPVPAQNVQPEVAAQVDQVAAEETRERGEENGDGEGEEGKEGKKKPGFFARMLRKRD